jgi:hypothetical protein
MTLAAIVTLRSWSDVWSSISTTRGDTILRIAHATASLLAGYPNASENMSVLVFDFETPTGTEASNLERTLGDRVAERPQ